MRQTRLVAMPMLAICIAATTTYADADQQSRRRPGPGKPAASKPVKREAAPTSKAATSIGISRPVEVPTITLLGEFEKPGIIPFTSGMTVKDAIEAAAGFTKFADSRSVTLKRLGIDSLASVDGARALSGDVIQNAILKPGDVLYAAAKKVIESKEPEPPAAADTKPASEVAEAAQVEATSAPSPTLDESFRIQIEGAVEKPGAYIYSKMMMRDLFDQVGGLKKDADSGKIVIYRGVATDPGSAQQIKYDLGKVQKGRTGDVELQPGDVIQVPVKRRSIWDKVGGAFKKIGTRTLLNGVPVVGPVIGSLTSG